MGTKAVISRRHTTQLRDTQFGRGIVQVLRHLNDPVYLHSHVLTRLVGTEGPEPSGESLREAVTGAIEELRRASGTNRSAARGADILKLYYIQSLDRDEILRRLPISRTEFHRALARAQESLVGSLAQRWGITAQPGRELDTGVAIGALVPTPLDRLVGRATELQELEQLLLRDSGVRLVTIQGPPGAGKTRLAIELAQRLSTTFRDGVFYVGLATVDRTEAVLEAIVIALGLSRPSDSTAEACLETFFRPREALLVLDNLEHLPGAGRLIAGLLSAGPCLKVLATSRSALRVSGEHGYPLFPLAVPPNDWSDDSVEGGLAALQRCEAVELFVERARAADSSFALTARNARAVATICRQVDGLPLAIELVAARTRSLSAHAIVRRLSHRLDLAAGRDVDRPARQQSLRTAIAWSYDLLGPHERRLFRLLGIFAGPCSLDAIEAVAGSPGLLDTLDELVAQSLVRRLESDDGESYFEMLVTIREFALEELLANAEAAAFDQRFCAYYLALAGESVAGLRGPLQISWANQLATETPNLVKTINRLLENEPEQALDLVAALGSFWIYCSHLSVGREWSERALQFADAAPLAAARVRFNAAVIARDQGDVDLAQRYLETSLRQFQTLSSARGVALCHNFLGLLALQKGDYTLARHRVMASHVIYERMNSQWGIGWTYVSLGTICEQQRRLPQARALFERASAILDDIGDYRGVAAALSGLGNVQRLLGDFDRSRANLKRALHLQRQSGHLSGAEVTLLALSGVAHHAGQFEAAHEYIDEAIRIATRIGDRRNLPTAHAFRIVLLKSEGRFAEARRLAEQILTMYRERGDVPWMALLHATIGDLADRAGGADAADYFRQSLQWLSVLNDRWVGARTIALVGLSAARRGQLADALRALGAAEATHSGIRTNFDYSNYAEWVTVESQACEQLGLLGATLALEEGKAMDFGRAIAFARGLLAGATLPSALSVRGSPYSAETRWG